MSEMLKKKVSAKEALAVPEKEKVKSPTELAIEYIARSVEEIEVFNGDPQKSKSGTSDLLATVYLSKKKVKSPFIEEEFQDPIAVAEALRARFIADAEDPDIDEINFIDLVGTVGGQKSILRVVNIPERGGVKTLTCLVKRRERPSNLSGQLFVLPKTNQQKIAGAPKAGASFAEATDDEDDDDE